MVYARTLRYDYCMKPLAHTSTAWTSQLAYAVGLITTDGSLSKDGRHMAFISKDLELINTFRKCLNLENTVAFKASGYAPEATAYVVQFGDVNFYKFLVSLGLTPNKSKSMSELKIPPRYFFDFLRGHFDGDGSFYSYWDKRWASSFMFYLTFISASLDHLLWLRQTILSQLGVAGHMNTTIKNRAHQLKYAKKEAVQIIDKMYKDAHSPRLDRKYKKIYNALAIDNSNP